MKLFFDVDAVLIDGYSNNPALCRKWHTDIEKDLGILESDVSKLFQDNYHPVSIGKKPLENAVSMFLKEIEANISTETFIDYWFEKDSILNRPVWDWLEKSNISKESLFLATDQEERRAQYLWNNLEFKNYFTQIFYSGNCGASKAQAEFFKIIKDRTGYVPNECIIIDDNSAVIDTAMSCGWHTILYEGPNSLDDLRFKISNIDSCKTLSRQH